MRFFLLFCLVFLFTETFGQLLISGKIVDSRTNLAIVGASVYVNNTTCGTMTNENGEFAFSCRTTGKTELVFTHVGYTKLIKIVEATGSQNLSISLSSKQNDLNEVVISSPKKITDEDKTRWFKLFSLNLIGSYMHGSNLCKIKNPEVLNYYFDNRTKELTVTASNSLLFENPLLGFNIKIDLENFSYNLTNNEVAFKYSCFFEDLKKNKTKSKEVTNNRIMAYKGSSMHFMRSLFANRLIDEGFQIFKYSTIANLEKKRVKDIVLRAIAETYEKEENPNVAIQRLYKRDTALYYEKVLKDKDALSFKVDEIGALQLTVKDKLTRTINFDFADTLLVNYHRDGIKKAVIPISVNGMKASPTPKTHGENRPPLSTYLYFFEAGGINIQNNGYYPEFSLFMYGDMAERRIASALPYDYEPSEDLE